MKTDLKLIAELDALRKDAARYQWLRNSPANIPTRGVDLAFWEDECGDSVRGEDADAAIDAAMKGKQA